MNSPESKSTSVPLTIRQTAQRDVPREHPRLLGDRKRLEKLKNERPDAYQRVIQYARRDVGEAFYPALTKMIGLGLLYVLEGDERAGREAVELTMKQYITRGIETGHVTFGHSLARCALVYDMCHALWTPAERELFFDYGHRTIDGNVEEEPSVFHNGWYGYKHWGYGLFAYATMYENPRAQQILAGLEKAYEQEAAPGLEFSGDGGGFAEGYYIHYWLYEWLFFTEVARLCDGADYYALAPRFYKQRAIASMFEMYPKLDDAGTRRPVPMGDGGGRNRNAERDKALAARWILCSHYRDDPAHQVVHTFNQQMKTSFDFNAVMDFLWHDQSIPQGDLDSFKLAHLSKAAGYVYARSSWKDDASYLFFHCGRRFTAHQHLDNGGFVLFKTEELLGDGGEYDSFDTDHCVNAYLRTIVHNCILVYDPKETWPRHSAQTPKGMRFGPPGVNDGGQKYPWSGTPWRHNGAPRNVSDWMASRELGEIAEMLAYEDAGAYVYMAGDATRSYSDKVKAVTRQIVFLRGPAGQPAGSPPGTFVIFDRVMAADASFKKTFLLQTMQVPVRQEDGMLVVSSGNGRLFAQTLLPQKAKVELYHGDRLYEYGGVNHPPQRTTGPAPLCRVEISRADQGPAEDCFLHVLTTTDAGVMSVAKASATIENGHVNVRVGEVTIRFEIAKVGGAIDMGGTSRQFANALVE